MKWTYVRADLHSYWVISPWFYYLTTRIHKIPSDINLDSHSFFDCGK